MSQPHMRTHSAACFMSNFVYASVIPSLLARPSLRLCRPHQRRSVVVTFRRVICEMFAHDVACLRQGGSRRNAHGRIARIQFESVQNACNVVHRLSRLLPTPLVQPIGAHVSRNDHAVVVGLRRRFGRQYGECQSGDYGRLGHAAYPVTTCATR